MADGETDAKTAQRMLIGQNRVLERIAGRADLKSTLEEIVRLVEELLPGSLCSVLLLDRDAVHLRFGAGASLPAAYNAAIDGVAIGPSVGSCGTAAFLRTTVVVRDIATDPLWEKFRDLALANGLRSCWSVPILASGSDRQKPALGTFAVYQSEPGEPGPEAFGIIGQSAHLVRVAIERQRTEDALRESEERLYQSQKMEAVGQLAGGIAHDFNNMLGAILGNAELGRIDVADDHPVAECLDEIVKVSQRARSMVQQILAFSRRQPSERRVTALAPVVDESVRLMRATVPAGVEIVRILGDGIPDVLLDPTQAHQILLNLCTNAWHAMEDATGRIEIRISGVDLDEGEAARIPGLSAGRHACLEIRDTGRGMDAPTLGRVFEPFFTTKKPGEGTGLGLSVVHGIVRNHDGAISVSSVPGKGSTFSVYFPAAPQDAQKDEPASPTPLRGRGQRILYLDDEPSLVSVATRMIRRLGYEVIAFHQVAAALDAFRRNPESFDLVITDFSMPGVSGFQVAQEILTLRPETPVILNSGVMTEELLQRARSLGIRQCILKPNSVGELSETLRKWLPQTAHQ